MGVLTQLVVSTLLLWKTQRNLDCNKQVLCFLINKVHRTLSDNEGFISAEFNGHAQENFWKTAIVNLADENKDRKVSLGEFRQKSVVLLRYVFKIFDSNLDGFLSRNESMVDRLSTKDVSEAFNFFFQLLDQNQDRKISADDLPEKYRFDIDEDGEVTLLEFIEKVSGQKIVSLILLPGPILLLLESLDPSGDEQITKKEYEDFILKVIGTFNDNQDCYLTTHEIMKMFAEKQFSLDEYLHPFTRGIEEIVGALINHADENSDDKVDLYEVISFSDFDFLKDAARILKYSSLTREPRFIWSDYLENDVDASLWLTIIDKVVQKQMIVGSAQSACMYEDTLVL